MNVLKVYKRLRKHFGHRHWWPGDTPFEVMVGAILTQNTAWTNVEKAIANIKAADALNPQRLLAMSDARLGRLLRPSGYLRIKTKRLKSFLRFYEGAFHSSVATMRRVGLPLLRERLLGVNGIGPETADSILLYALNKPVFVVDAYTKRIFSRLGCINADMDYHAVQNYFVANLPTEVRLYNDYHAQIVQLGKEMCRKSSPRCAICPLKDMCGYAAKGLRINS